MQLKHQLSAIAALTALLTPCQAAYSLKDDYTAQNFFDGFTFFTENDPTNGYVDYISQSAASSAGLINTNNNQIYMGVDSKNVASGRGRKSVRITSKATYNHALILLDLEHMPDSTCGTWPAFWTVGPNWPHGGEIDIIEGVNTQSANSMALHTGPGCSISTSGGGSSNAQQAFSGSITTPNCDVAASGQANNAGCGIKTSDSSTYGSGLNSAQGGIYATEWNSNVIQIWFFPRGSIPTDIDSGSPTPGSWGAPLAAFGSGSCDIDAAFSNQQIVFDTTFCGDWAGSVWSSDSTCSKKASTCQDFVQNNPEAFANSFWTVNSLRVYTGADDNSGPKPSASVSNSVSRPVSSGAVTGRPPVASSTGVGISQPFPTGSAGTGKPVPTGGVSNTYAPPFQTSNVPSAPVPTYPTTMYTSSRWGNDNGNTRSWGGDGGHRTRTRGWGSPPRLAKWAAAHLGLDVNVDSDYSEDTATATAALYEARSVSLPEQTGVSQPENEVLTRTLIRPVVRRDEGVDGDIENEGQSESETRRARRQHLGRHKERRHIGGS